MSEGNRSCESCIRLYRKICVFRAEDGNEYRSEQRACSLRNVPISYPVDSCASYRPWKRGGRR